MKSNISNELIKRIYENAGTPIRKELEKEVPELIAKLKGVDVSRIRIVD